MAISRKPRASNFLRGRISSHTMGATARNRSAVKGGLGALPRPALVWHPFGKPLRRLHHVG